MGCRLSAGRRFGGSGFQQGRKLQSLTTRHYRLTRGSGMKLLFGSIYVLIALLLGGNLAAQTTSSVRGADERFKADILVVVAHPDDEGAVTPYLAKIGRASCRERV